MIFLFGFCGHSRWFWWMEVLIFVGVILIGGGGGDRSCTVNFAWDAHPPSNIGKKKVAGQIIATSHDLTPKVR